MSKINILLSTLDGVKRTGQGRYIAKCPAHNDRSPSLAIKETDDGKVLLHCFAGCSANEVVYAVGMSLEDLFPESTKISKGERKPFNPYDILECLNNESLIIALSAVDIVAGRTISETDSNRISLAHERINTALNIARGK